MRIKTSNPITSLKKEFERIKERSKSNLGSSQQDDYLKTTKNFLKKLDQSKNHSVSVASDWISNNETRGLIMLTLLKETKLCKYREVLNEGPNRDTFYKRIVEAILLNFCVMIGSIWNF